MEYKAKIAYLESYRALYARCVGLESELQQWTDLGTRINQRYDVQGGHSGEVNSKVEMSGLETAEICHKIELELREATNRRDDVKNALKSLKKDYHRLVLELRYIQGLPVWRVAKILHKSEDTIKYIVRAAVNSLDIGPTKEQEKGQV